jgi:hypothetical protein
MPFIGSHRCQPVLPLVCTGLVPADLGLGRPRDHYMDEPLAGLPPFPTMPGMGAWLVSVIAPLVGGAIVLYWVIRLAVAGALKDADRRRTRER